MKRFSVSLITQFSSVQSLSRVWLFAAAAAKSLQLCPTLCDPIDGRPPGSPVPGILQARPLEWVAISFSNARKWKVKVKSLSCVRPSATPWITAFQAAPSMGFFPAGVLEWGAIAFSGPTFCDPMNRSTPGLPVHHHLLEFTQTHVHRVGDAIQPSHPLSSPSPPAPNLSQHQGLFQWVNSSHEVAKTLEFQLQDQFFQRTPRTDLL